MSKPMWVFILCASVAGGQGSSQSSAAGERSKPCTTDAALQAQIERMQKQLQDWLNFARYRDENRRLGQPKPGESRVVFIGDSITDFWGRRAGTFFTGKPYINRGIAGQTTSQVLIRFRPDVVALMPKVVVVLAGTNDIAGNTGPMTPEDIVGNIKSITELARANKIKVVLGSLLPVSDGVRVQTARRPPDKIRALNEMIRTFAAESGAVYVDYFTPMADERGHFRTELTEDGLHPNTAGYRVMEPLAERAISVALN